MGCCCKKTNKNDINTPLIPKEESPIQETDFEKLKLLGKGSFGKVYLVRQKNTKNLFAMKILSKEYLKEKNEQEHTKTERQLLSQLNNPFIINLYYAFQNEKYLFLISDFIQGGDLFFHLKRERFFSDEKSKFYICELILALEYLHNKNMIYRDLKPENILIDKTGHIKLTDFGLSKIIDKKKKKFTICGTPQYIAPEVFQGKYDKCVDWWSLGCLLYEFLSGKVLFRVTECFDLNIYKNPIQMLNHFTNEAKLFLKDILVVDPIKRLGYGKKGIENIKKHIYFKDINWDDVFNKKMNPPFIPILNNDEDLRYFDKEFTEESILDTNSNDTQTENYTYYNEFTYYNVNALEIG